MRVLKAKDMVAVVDFIYHGEANIYQEDLGGFLIHANELQLKGLAQEEISETEKKKFQRLRKRKQSQGNIYYTLTYETILQQNRKKLHCLS